MLTLKNVDAHAGTFTLHDITLTVPDGSYTVILGPTGAGKTVLLETIAGINPVTAGSIHFNDTDITAMAPELREFSMVYQDYMLFPHLTVAENIRFGLKKHAEITDIAELLSITHLLDRWPETLSGGEQQRVALARALAVHPQILLLDEPLSALDTVSRKKLYRILKKIHTSTGITILHITHHFEDMQALADYAVIVNDGRILQTGTPGEIMQHPTSVFAATFTGMDNILTGIAENGVIHAGGRHICCTAEPLNGPVTFGIRAENLHLANEAETDNLFSGTVIRVEASGAVLFVTIDCGMQLVAAVPNSERIAIGDRIQIHYRNEDVWICKHTETH